MGIKYLEGKILILRNELYQLKRVNQAQEVRIQERSKIINELTVANTNLQNQLTHFKDKLNINSTNSSLPTSRDIYRIERKSRPSTGRKAGRQPGHVFKGYKFNVPDKIINIAVFKLAKSMVKKPLEEFLPEYQGKVISDRYAVYNIFDSEKRQVCLAYFRRNFKRFAYNKQ